MSFLSVIVFIVIVGLLVFEIYKLVTALKKRKKFKDVSKQDISSPDESQKN